MLELSSYIFVFGIGYLHFNLSSSWQVNAKQLKKIVIFGIIC